MCSCALLCLPSLLAGFVLLGPPLSPAALLPSRPHPPDQHQDGGRPNQRERSLKQSGHDPHGEMSRHTEPSVLFSCPAETGYHSILLSCLKILEKMRPLDHKLKYQIDKLVRTAVTGSLGKRFIYSNFCKLWWKKVIDLQIKERTHGEWDISHYPCFTGLSKQLCHVLLFQLKMIHCSFVLTQRISSVK